MNRSIVLFAVFSLRAWAADYPITAYGAVANDGKSDTKAVQQAITKCSEAGGGKVVVAAGTFLIETIRLASNVELHLEQDAVLLGSKEEARYGHFATNLESRDRRSRWNRGLIIGESLKRIAITGKGVIDGNDARDKNGEEGMRGPHTVLLQSCEQVTLAGIGIRNSGNYALLFYSCKKIMVEDVAFTGGWDGVHFRGVPDSWNREVTIRNCRFETGDDAIAGHHIEDSLVENCFINSSCNGIRLIGPARRWTIRECKFKGPGTFPHITQSRQNMLAGILLQPGAWGRCPGPVEDLTISNIEMKDVACAFQIVAGGPENPMGRISVSKLKATGIYQAAASVEAWNEALIEGVKLNSVHLSYTDQARVSPDVIQPQHVARAVPAWGMYVRSVKNIEFNDSLLEGGNNAISPAVLADKIGSISLERTNIRITEVSARKLSDGLIEK